MSDLLVDGFESGSLAAWTGKSEATGCSVSTETNNPHHGTYNMKSYVPSGTASGSSSVAYKDLGTTYETLYMRVYLKFDALPEDTNDYHPFLGFWQGATSNNMARAGVHYNGSIHCWFIRGISSGTTFTNYYGTSTPQVNRWYCLELQAVRGDGTGAYRLYVNGTLEVEATGLSNTARTMRYARVGFDSGIPPDLSNLNIYVDCVVVSDAYIGPDSAAYYLTTKGELLLPSDESTTPKLSNQEIINAIYKWAYENGEWVWQPEGFKTGSSYQKFRGEYYQYGQLKNQYLNLFLILSTDNEMAPLLVTDQGFIVKKDITAGGYISSQQGELWLGHGRNDYFDKPKIILMHADPDGYALGYGTLYLRKLLIEDEIPSVEEHRNLDLGDLTAHGYIYANNLSPIPAQNWIDVNSKLRINGDLQLDNGHVVLSLNPSGSVALGSPTEPWTGVVATTTYTNTLTPISPATTINVSGVLSCSGAVHGGGSIGDAFKVGDDMYLVDVNEANTVCLQGAQDRANAKIYFGSGKDTNLYRSAPDVLKTDDSFICGNITGNDAIFNSVKGTYAGAAVKAGDYITLSWDTNYSYITAHNRHMQLNTDIGKEVYVYRNLRVGGQLLLPTQGSSGGIVIGGDVNLYRSSANVLKTDDYFNVGSNLIALGGAHQFWAYDAIDCSIQENIQGGSIGYTQANPAYSSNAMNIRSGQGSDITIWQRVIVPTGF